MISLLILIAGAALVILGVLVLIGLISLGAPWWVLMLVGVALIIFGLWLRGFWRGRTVV